MGIMYKLMKHRNLTMDLSTKPTAKTKTKSDKCRLLTVDGQIIESPSGETSMDNFQEQEKDIEKRFTAEHILQLCKFLAEKSKGNKNLYKKQQSPKKFSKTPKHFQFPSMDYDPTQNGNDNCDSGDNSDNCHDDYEFNDDDEDINVRVYDNDNHHIVHNGRFQNEALPLLSKSRYGQKQTAVGDEDLQMTPNVLSSRLSPDINALNISATCTSSSATNTALLSAGAQRHHTSRQQQQHHLQQERLPQQHQQQGKRDILLKIRHQIFERKRLREKGYEPQVLNASSQVWRPW